MPLYRYDSFNRRGAKVAGTIDAASMVAAKELLRGQGLMPTSVAEVSYDSTDSLFSLLFQRGVEPKSVIMFTKQLAILLRSSVPLLQAIELLTEQFSGKFRRIIISIKDGLKSGESLAKELNKHPRVFSNVYVQLVKAGEASGKLDSILERLTEYLEKTADTKKRVQAAFRGPLITLSIATFIVVGLMTFMVPAMLDMLTKMDKALPLPTQILVNISEFLREYYLALYAGVFACVIWFTYWANTAQGKYRIDEILLKFPLTAYFSRTSAVVQFSKTLGLLIESGVNLSEALDIVCKVVENNVLARKLQEARDKIIKEGKIAKYLKESGIFPNIAIYMIGTGEQSGKLGHMLLVVGNDYDVELSEIIDRLVGSINPVVMVVMGGIVGFIVMSVLLPVLSMGDIPGM